MTETTCRTCNIYSSFRPSQLTVPSMQSHLQTHFVSKKGWNPPTHFLPLIQLRAWGGWSISQLP